MNITPSNIRSVFLQALLLIFLPISRTKADEIEEPLEIQAVNLDYFHNVPNLDPKYVISTNSFDQEDMYAAAATLATTIETIYCTSPTVLEPTHTTTSTTTTTITQTTTTRTTTKTSKKITTTATTKSTSRIESKDITALSMSLLNEPWTETSLELATDSTADFIADSTAEETLESENDSPASSLEITPSYIVPTMTLPLSILNSITTSSTASTSTPSIYFNTTTSNTTTQYTNTSDPLVQYDLECRVNDEFCIKVSRAVGAAIDEFTRVINVKINLL